MSTLIIGAIINRAKDEFDVRGLSQDNGDNFIGHFYPLYGSRYDEIIFTDPLVLDEKSWEWFSRDVLTRMAPGGEIKWELQ